MNATTNTLAKMSPELAQKFASVSVTSGFGVKFMDRFFTHSVGKITANRSIDNNSSGDPAPWRATPDGA